MTSGAFPLSLEKGSDSREERMREMHIVRKFRKWILALGFVSIVVGYVVLGLGSISLAPVLLVLGYCVLVPLALL